MTHFTDRNYIKPILWEITPMMILLCLIGAITALQGIRAGQFPVDDSGSNGSTGFSLFGMTNCEMIYGFSAGRFAFFCLSILVTPLFGLFCLVIPSSGDFAFFAFFIFSITPFSSLFAFFALSVAFLNGLTFFGLMIMFHNFITAYFAIMMNSIMRTSIFVKFRKLFEILAFGATFCLNCFSHSLFHFKRLRLEPIAAHTVVGSSYYIPIATNINNIFLKKFG